MLLLILTLLACLYSSIFLHLSVAGPRASPLLTPAVTSNCVRQQSLLTSLDVDAAETSTQWRY